MGILVLSGIPIAKSKHGCCLYHNSIIVAGGDAKSESRRCFIFDLHSGEWTELPSLVREHHRPVVLSYQQRSCVVVVGHALKADTIELLDERASDGCYTWIATDIRNHPIDVDFRAGIVGRIGGWDG